MAPLAHVTDGVLGAALALGGKLAAEWYAARARHRGARAAGRHAVAKAAIAAEVALTPVLLARIATLERRRDEDHARCTAEIAVLQAQVAQATTAAAAAEHAAAAAHQLHAALRREVEDLRRGRRGG